MSDTVSPKGQRDCEVDCTAPVATAGLGLSLIHISEPNVQIGRHYEIRHGKRGKRRELGLHDRSREHPQPADRAHTEMPVGPPFCTIDGSSRGRPWSSRRDGAAPPLGSHPFARAALPEDVRSLHREARAVSSPGSASARVPGSSTRGGGPQPPDCSLSGSSWAPATTRLPSCLTLCPRA